MDRDISLDAIKLVACIFVCTLHTIGMFMPESSDFHFILSFILYVGDCSSIVFYGKRLFIGP